MEFKRKLSQIFCWTCISKFQLGMNKKVKKVRTSYKKCSLRNCKKSSKVRASVKKKNTYPIKKPSLQIPFPLYFILSCLQRSDLQHYKNFCWGTLWWCLTPSIELDYCLLLTSSDLFRKIPHADYKRLDMGYVSNGYRLEF